MPAREPKETPEAFGQSVQYGQRSTKPGRIRARTHRHSGSELRRRRKGKDNGQSVQHPNANDNVAGRL